VLYWQVLDQGALAVLGERTRRHPPCPRQQPLGQRPLLLTEVRGEPRSRSTARLSLFRLVLGYEPGTERVDVYQIGPVAHDDLPALVALAFPSTKEDSGSPCGRQ